MDNVIYFNRGTGEVYVSGPGRECDLKEFLEKFHKDFSQFEVIHPIGPVRIRAMGEGYLDVTSMPYTDVSVTIV